LTISLKEGLFGGLKLVLESFDLIEGKAKVIEVSVVELSTINTVTDDP
jgi:hypothetical protein